MKKVLIFSLLLLTLFSCVSKKTEEIKIEPENKKPVQAVFLDDGPTLREAAEIQGMYMGAAVNPAYFSKDEYRDTLSNHFNYITAENVMKWIEIHPQPEEFKWRNADRIVDFAMEHGMKVRGHTLIWHSQAPQWLIDPEVAWDRDTLTAAIKYHIDNVAGRYAGKIYAWDVINEAIDGSNYRKTVFYETLGKDYIAMAFRMAHEAAPDANLYYNDYGIEKRGTKSNAVYTMVKELLDDGVPIHGVGLQGHLTVSRNWAYNSTFALFNQQIVD